MKTENKKSECIKSLIVMAMVAMFCAIAITTYIYYVENISDQYLGYNMVFVGIQKLFDPLCWGIAGVIYGVLILFWRYGAQICEFIYKYRYAIAGALFIVGIIMEINGSSIQHLYGF